MEQLHLVGVHDDGEHLIVESSDSQRFLLRIDQQVRQAVQHARKKAPARGVGGTRFGPRDIQVRFRSGASVDDIVAESGWEPERVKRYEWPILAERAHVVREACKIKINTLNPSHDGYRSVFEGEPRTLEETVRHRAPALGVAVDSFDWDAWQREDQLWTVQLSFLVSREDQSPLQIPGPAEWTFNPANQSLRAVNDWARSLCEEPRDVGPLGTPTPVPARTPHVEEARPEPVQDEPGESGESEELLDVLQARRGRRLGSDVDDDDRLAEILGRSMGQVDNRPRPIDAPEDSPLFNQPIQPAAAHLAEERALEADGDIEIIADPSGTTTSLHEQDEVATSPTSESGTVPLGARLTVAAPSQLAQAAPGPTGETHQITEESVAGAPEPHEAVHAETATDTSTGSHPAQPPGPRGRTGKAKRSAVPSWHDIVFGSNSS